MRPNTEAKLGLSLVLAVALTLGGANTFAALQCFTAAQGDWVLQQGEAPAAMLYETKNRAAIIAVLGSFAPSVDRVRFYLAADGETVGVLLYFEGCILDENFSPAKRVDEVRILVFSLETAQMYIARMKMAENRSFI